MITRLNIGGPAVHAINLTTALERHGFETYLLHGKLAPGEGDMSDQLPATANARFVETLRRPISLLGDARTLLRLYRAFRRIRPRIVHTHMAKAGLLGRLAAVAYNWTRGSAPRAHIVHTYHGHVLEGYFNPVISSVFLNLERLLARFSDALVAISPALQRQLLEGYRIGSERQYRLIPLGFDLKPFYAIDEAARVGARAALNLPRTASVITTVGRLTAIKRHELFLDVVAHVRQRRPDLIALVAGDGERRGKLQRHAERLELQNSVRWLGWRRDLATVYAASDVFVLTSRNEGTPVAMIEAMASGVPPVSTDVGGVRDVIGGADAGVVVRTPDASVIAKSIDLLLLDEARRRMMSESARKRVERFDVERLTDDIASLYRDLLSNR